MIHCQEQREKERRELGKREGDREHCFFFLKGRAFFTSSLPKKESSQSNAPFCSTIRMSLRPSCTHGAHAICVHCPPHPPPRGGKSTYAQGGGPPPPLPPFLAHSCVKKERERERERERKEASSLPPDRYPPLQRTASVVFFSSFSFPLSFATVPRKPPPSFLLSPPLLIRSQLFLLLPLPSCPPTAILREGGEENKGEKRLLPSIEGGGERGKWTTINKTRMAEGNVDLASTNRRERERPTQHSLIVPSSS